MPLVKRMIMLAAASALLGAPAAKAGPNVPLCLTLENNYNQCMAQLQRQNAWGGYGGWGGDYGGGWDDEDYYYRQRRQQRSLGKQAECARWLYAVQQNGCAR